MSSTRRLSVDLNRPLDEIIQEQHNNQKSDLQPHNRHRNQHHNNNSNNHNYNRRSPRRQVVERRYDSDRIRKPDSRRHVHYSPLRPQQQRPYSNRPRDTEFIRSRDNTRVRYNRHEPKSAIRISNLHYEVTEKDLKELFESIGPVHRAVIDYDRAGRSNGRATVHFLERDDAYRARERFLNVPLDGKAMQIEILRIPAHSQQGDVSMELDAEMDRYMMSAPSNQSHQRNQNQQRYYDNNNQMQID